MQLKRNEREARRDILVAAAKKVFGEKPFHEIGMRDIAKEAGVSAASIYRYFPTKDELFVETLIQEIDGIEKRFQKQIRNGHATIEEIALAHIDYLLENEATFQLMTHFMIHRQIHPDTLEKFNIVQRYFLNMIDTVITRAGAKENIRMFSHAFFASITGVVMTFRNYPGREKADIRKHMHRLALTIANAFKAGIAETDAGTSSMS